MEKDFNRVSAEKAEADLLIDKGVFFTTPITSWICKLLGQKERRWTIKQPFLGTLDLQAPYQIKMDIDEDKIQKDPLVESKIITAKASYPAAMIIAMAVLNSRLSILFFARPLAYYFLWHIQPKKLIQIAILINTISDYGNFINSIRLMSASRRTTAPMEGRIEDQGSEVLMDSEDKY